MSGRFESASAVERPSPSSQVVQPGAQQATTYPAITATGAPAYAPDDPGLGAATYATASADPGGCIDSHCRVHAQVASTPRPAASQGLLDAEARLSQVNASENGTQGQQATTDGQTAATGGQTVTTTEGQATATAGQPQPGVTGLVSEDWTGALDNQAAANQAVANPSASPGLNGKVFSQGDATGLGGGLSPIYGKGVFTGGVITDLPVMPDTENPNG